MKKHHLAIYNEGDEIGLQINWGIVQMYRNYDIKIYNTLKHAIENDFEIEFIGFEETENGVKEYAVQK
jgi:hypothetical protein